MTFIRSFLTKRTGIDAHVNSIQTVFKTVARRGAFDVKLGNDTIVALCDAVDTLESLVRESGKQKADDPRLQEALDTATMAISKMNSQEELIAKLAARVEALEKKPAAPQEPAQSEQSQSTNKSTK